jgi:hypothetical protein
MNELIHEARAVAHDIVDMVDLTEVRRDDLVSWGELYRRLADALHAQSIELESRKKCHENILAIAGDLADQLLLAATKPSRRSA